MYDDVCPFDKVSVLTLFFIMKTRVGTTPVEAHIYM